MKGFLGGLLNIVGWASVFFVMFLGFWEAANQSTDSTQQNGVAALVENAIDDPEIRDSVTQMQVSTFFLTPLLTTTLLGREVSFSIDAFTILIVLILSMSVVFAVSWLFHPSLAYIIPIFILSFLVAATLWQGFWLDRYFESGEKLGIDRPVLLDNLKSSGALFQNQILLVLNIITFGFVFYKLYGYIPGV